MIDAAYEKRSIAISSNIHPSGFDELMPKSIATATVDRLLHHAHVLITEGQDSYRLAQATAGKGVRPLTRTPAAPTWWGETMATSGEKPWPRMGRKHGRRWEKQMAVDSVEPPDARRSSTNRRGTATHRHRGLRWLAHDEFVLVCRSGLRRDSVFLRRTRRCRPRSPGGRSDSRGCAVRLVWSVLPPDAFVSMHLDAPREPRGTAAGRPVQRRDHRLDRL